MLRSRSPAVAGMFYPDDPGELRHTVRDYLNAAAVDGPAPKALIAPHAGYIYSGAVAASAYAHLGAVREQIRRVVLLGPAHRIPFRGIALSSTETFETPLGDVAIDQNGIAAIADLPQVQTLDEAHRLEHSLEVQLPFLQEALEDFKLVPLLVGEASPESVAEILERLWGGPETLIVISSDLSHYHDYDTARQRDRTTSTAIETLQESAIGYDDACGRNPINGLLYVAKRCGLRARTVDLRNSGDTAGPRDQVVGYGAYVFH